MTRPLAILAFAAVAAASGGLVCAQDSQPTTRPSNDTAPASRNAEIERLIAELRRSAGVEQASLRAQVIYGRPGGPRRLLVLLADRAFPEVAWRGVGAAMVFAADRDALPVLFAQYASGAGSRDHWIEDQLREFDRALSIEDELMGRLGDARKDVVLGSLRLLAEIADVPDERVATADVLIRSLMDSQLIAYEAEVQSTLARLTFHDFQTVDAWSDWLENFRKSHPQGFSESDLFSSALREKDRRFFQEAKRGVERALSAKQPPTDWLDRRRYPEISIRQYAASRFLALRDSESETLKQAVGDLLQGLVGEPDAETVALRLKSAGALAEGRDSLRQVVAPEARARLKSGDPGIVLAALTALAQTGVAEDAAAVEDLFRTSDSGEAGASTREECIATLYSLGSGFGTIIAAVGDPAWQVRATAARILAYGKQVAAAPRLAQALDAERQPEAQMAMVKAIAQLSTFPDDVVASLLAVARRPGPASEIAVRALLDAAAVDAIQSSSEGSVVATLAELLPAMAPTPERRASFLSGLPSGRGGALGRVVAGWMDIESSPDAIRDLAAVLARIAPNDVAMLDAYGRRLLRQGRARAASTLLRSALDVIATPTSRPDSRLSAPSVREALTRALLADGVAEALIEASRHADVLVAARPDDGRIRLLRGEVSSALGRASDAAKDWLLALENEGGALGDERRVWERRALEALVDAGDASGAMALLARLPSGYVDREFLVAAGRVEAANDRRREAATRFRNALKAPGRVDESIARYRLAEVLVRSPFVADHNEARRLVDALELAPGLPATYSLEPLRAAIQDDRRREAAVRAMDAAPSSDELSAREVVSREGLAILPWLVGGISEAARTPTTDIVRRRAEVVRALIADWPGDIVIPRSDGTAEAWIAFADAFTGWWSGRMW